MPDMPTAHPPAGLTWTETSGSFTLQASGYSLAYDSARPYLSLSDVAGMPYADLFLGASLHSTSALDSTARLSDPEIIRTSEQITLRFVLEGGAWVSKTLILTCDASGLDAQVKVSGQGHLTDVHLFGGYYSGHLRWGSGFFESGARFERVFNPEPWGQERRSLPAGQSTSLDVMGTSLPGKAHWFFTPAPLLYAFTAAGALGGGSLGADQGGTPQELERAASGLVSGSAANWLAVSVVAPANELKFSGFHYDAHESSFSLRLSYEGQTQVDGTFCTPPLRLEFASDPYAAIARNAELHRLRGFSAEPSRVQPHWWSAPIQCGWGAQCHLANSRGGRAPEHCTQANYDAFLTALDGHDLHPGTLVIDDKWSLTYGQSEVDPAKWPDLPAWIARAHVRGQKVLLWWKAWDAEGLPIEACVTNELGEAIAADPTSPAYQAILRASVRRMLLDYGADGFKVDFSARTPSGPNLRRHGQAWGVALLHTLLKLLRDEAKRCKPDALIMTHTPHPAFADVSDMIRLNDVNALADVNAQMLHRARVARAALPGHLIDTDNWPMPSRAAWRDYLRLQPDLGVPSLYFATHLDGDGQPITAQDARLIRETWARWEQRRCVDPLVLPPETLPERGLPPA